MARPQQFKPGNPGGGRPKGSKNRLPAAIKLAVLQNLSDDYERIMTLAARSRRRVDQRWFADQYRRLLPKDETVTVTGDKQLVLVVPAPSDDEPTTS